MSDELKPCQLTAAETIHIFENSCLRSEHFTAESVTAAYVAALAALRAKATPNPPLTLDELRGMGDNLVWVEDWHVEWYGESRVGLERASEALTLAAWRAPEYYGEWWLAYRRKPKEE